VESDVYGDGRWGLQNVIIKNRTGEDLKDIYLTYGGLGKPILKISGISKDEQQIKSLIVNHLTKPINLILFYYKDNKKEEIVVYDNLIHGDLRTLTLTISINGDKFIVNTTFD